MVPHLVLGKPRVMALPQIQLSAHRLELRPQLVQPALLSRSLALRPVWQRLAQLAHLSPLALVSRLERLPLLRLADRRPRQSVLQLR